MIWHDQQNFIKTLCHFPWCFAGILAFPGARNYIAISEIARLQNSLVFFLKISKEIGKAWCKSLTRAKRASDARRACEGRGKKPTVRFSYNEFVPTRRFKNVVELSKICSQLHPLCEFDTLGDWFRGRIARVIVYTWLQILTLYPAILKQFLALLLCEM